MSYERNDPYVGLCSLVFSCFGWIFLSTWAQHLDFPVENHKLSTLSFCGRGRVVSPSKCPDGSKLHRLRQSECSILLHSHGDGFKGGHVTSARLMRCNLGTSIVKKESSLFVGKNVGLGQVTFATTW